MLKIITKKCNCCNLEIDLSNFYIKNKNTWATRGLCKKCWYIKSKDNKENNKEKTKQYFIDYSLENKERIKNRTQKWREKNKELLAEKANNLYIKKIDIIKEYNKQYYKKNKNEIIKKVIQYSKTPIGKAIKKNISNNRRLILRNGNIKNNELKNLIENAKKCYWCGISLKNVKTHIDHYEPLSKGGEHTISNIVVSCAKCNLKKGNKDPLEFAHTMGVLL